ncbi:MAG: FAD-binding oxidoreductase [Solirubrobacterales bacterium]|nr:FAD-binding oxidoreductase [Solirubrobacterales bacterium]OJU96083.1 MAG: FAD-binding oxidoreductase [Solirubrobacterales bacterium 67-14]
MPLLEPDVMKITPEAGEPASDRAPDWVAGGTPEPLRSELTALLGEEKLLGRATDLIRYASDASPYRILPQAVVMAHDAADVAAVLEFGRRKGIPVTFRSGGTSLNGQGQTAGILVDVRKHFTGVEVLEDGMKARVKPGTVLGHANKVLAPYGRKLGPDPASTDIATVGGVVNNNSGGMRCGVTYDSYSTVTGMTFVLPSGTLIDTEADDAEEAFAAKEPELASGLMKIREEILADRALAERIRHKFEIKNTTGYRLCAFLDGETPVEIFRRLIIGSEGTLAFVASVTFDTVELPAVTTTAWLHFPDIQTAVDPVPELVAAGATAVELMVAPALITAGWNMPGAPEYFKELDPESAALLVEFGGPDQASLDAQEAKAFEIVDAEKLILPANFVRDEESVEINWKVREGLHGLIGKMRLPGTALIIEDVCVPPARIAEAAVELRTMLAEHGFLAGVAGHASAGNLHFMLTPDFSKPEDTGRYETFMNALVEMICDKYDGALKAEHGTGINMAPYVTREWGEQAVDFMWRVKALADPENALNPGAILTRDGQAHLQNLKTTPQIEEEANACVECGFCEPVCPSRNLTTTPRQRIVLRREMVRQGEDTPVLKALLEEFEYEAIETCANDGSCLLVCPVGIDTGKFIKDFRAEQHTPAAERMALRAARRWDRIEKLARTGLKFGSAVSTVTTDGAMRGLTRAARKAISADLVPEWGEKMPPAASPELPETSSHGAAAVYMPACINRIFGRSKEDPGLSLPQAMVTVSARAGKPVWIPPDITGTCCSVPWSSKGYKSAHAFKANQTVERIWRWTGGGTLPLVIDASSCGHGLLDFGEGVLSEENAARHADLTILDSVRWAEEYLLPGLEVTDKAESVTVHPTCSGRHMGLERALTRIARAVAERVEVPDTATCCGFAGDRGMLHPELTASATETEAQEVKAVPTDRYVSSNRTCEVGLERATGEPYGSFIYLLEEATRP